MVQDASRYEDRPIWGKCSDRCFGKTWNPVHGKDKIYSPNEHWMFFKKTVITLQFIFSRVCLLQKRKWGRVKLEPQPLKRSAG